MYDDKNWNDFIDRLGEDEDVITEASSEDYAEIGDAADRLMALALDAAISEMRDEYGEDFVDHVIPSKISDTAMDIIRQEVRSTRLQNMMKGRGL